MFPRQTSAVAEARIESGNAWGSVSGLVCVALLALVLLIVACCQLLHRQASGSVTGEAEVG